MMGNHEWWSENIIFWLKPGVKIFEILINWLPFAYLMIMTNPPQTEISPISWTLFGWRYKIQRFKCDRSNQTILFHCFLELLPELIFWKCCFEPKFVGSESWNVEIKLPLMFLSLAAYSQKKEITFLHKMLLPAKNVVRAETQTQLKKCKVRKNLKHFNEAVSRIYLWKLPNESESSE